MKQNRHLYIGLLLILISAALYLAELSLPNVHSDLFTGIFLIHYAFPLIYMIIIRVQFERFIKIIFKKEHDKTFILLLVLSNIAAFSLNLTIPIFAESTDWLTAFLIVENCILILWAILPKSNKIVDSLIALILPFAVVFHLYQVFMIIPYSMIAIIGSALLGAPLLLFVPVFYLKAYANLFTRIQFEKWQMAIQIVGFAGLLAFTGNYLYQWKSVDELINDNYLEMDNPYYKPILPEWVTLAQYTNSNSYFEKYLKSRIVYQPMTSYERLGGFGNRNFTADKYHDPFVAICEAFFSSENLGHKTKINILNFLYDTRHESGERLWRGDFLKTSQMTTNIELFPEYRLAYTELILKIKNEMPPESWRRNQQEAFYTFQLPEGSVATSLSLWIEGEERKGILTSKAKAEKAYNTIVGRERRDPSVIYWMEGSQIRVRVFPCTNTEDRKVKIGVTSPLTKHEDKLIYKSITFKGPERMSGNHSVNLIPHGHKYESPDFFLRRKGNMYTYRGNYPMNYEFSIDCPPLSKDGFSFGENTYQVQETQIDYQSKEIQLYVLDINAAWTENELAKIKQMLDDKNVLYYDAYTHQLGHNHELTNAPVFTLFPFYKIKNPSQTLLITKGGMPTPNLNDIKETQFYDDIQQYFGVATNAKMLVLDLADQPSDYIRAIKEFQLIDYHPVSLKMLEKAIETQIYPTHFGVGYEHFTEIAGAQISIRKNNAYASEGSAPDHLMRLFSYQKTMDLIGNQFFSEDQYSEEAIDLAATSNVVTPVSSLIVLETQEDYDRFGIKQKENALGNASIGNNGAAPEPHEWALIIIGCMIFTYMIVKRKQRLTRVL